MRSCRESGFALLFIYAMAATIAIMLYMEIPRVAFEAQRDREQLLIDRGEQYSRAITLYVRKFNRYPADLDALNNTQNMHFLRQRYVDPMTGKDEWRLIHVGPGGVFTDSLVYNKKKDDKSSAPQNFITEMQQTGGNQTDPTQGVNLANRGRPSDQPGAPGDPNNQQVALPPPNPNQPFQPGGFQQGAFPPGMTPPGSGFPQPGLNQPGLPQFDANGQPITTGPLPQPVAPLPGQIPAFPPGVQAGQMPNGAPAGANLINQLLTTPRPGGLPGINALQQPATPTIDQYGNPVPVNPLTGNANAVLGAAAAAAANNTGTPLPAATGTTIGGGIAGVASKREQEGIKVYGDRKKYNEWEFVYDVTKDKARTGAGAVPAAPPPPGQALQSLQQMQQGIQQLQQQMQQSREQQLQQSGQQQTQQGVQPTPPGSSTTPSP
jgi:hypothetical protein